MTVYVDDMAAVYRPPHAPGRRYVMCHMVADSEAELHAMADEIGVDRRWHQAPPKHDSHYDIARSKRQIAIHQGAVPVTLRQLAAMNYRRRITGELGSPENAEQWLKAYARAGR